MDEALIGYIRIEGRRKRKAMKQLMKKNKTEWEKYQRRYT